MPLINTLGASGYPALQAFLSHVLASKKRLFLRPGRKFFLILLAAVMVEMVQEAL